MKRSVFLKVMRQEWRNMGADRSLGLAGLLFIVLIGYAVYGGLTWLRAQDGTVRLIAEDEAKRFDDVRTQLIAIEKGYRPTDPYADASRPVIVGGFLAYRHAVLPLTALAPLALGQSDLYTNYAGVTVWSNQRHHWSNRRSFIKNNEIENPTNLLAGRFDVAFVIIYLYPLLILTLSYNLISSEKEQGTLMMLLSQPVALKSIVMAKIALRATVILSLAVILSMVGVLLTGTGATSSDSLLRLFLWTLVVTAYGGFWFSLAGAVNAFGNSSATNAITLSSVWLTLVMVVPSLLNLVITSIYPTPPRVEFVRAMRQAWIEADARSDKLAAQFYRDHPELVPEDSSPDIRKYAATAFYAAQEEIDQRLEPIIVRFEEQLNRQQRTIGRFRFLSPALVMQEALCDIAGTGTSRFRHFRNLVEEFHGVWRNYFVPKLFRKEKFTLADHTTIPNFVYREEPLGSLVSRVSVGLAGLVAPTLLIAGFGIAALRRYPATN
jgi:ABC-2 type transport system permease protein